MQMFSEKCPNCGKPVLFSTGSLPTSQGTLVFEVPCPHCDAPFQVGYVDKLNVVWSAKQREDEERARRREEEQRKRDEEEASHTRGGTPAAAGAVGGGGGGTHPGPNDQRSHALNPNNPAYRAAASNRSNQMNPNNPAYRSSRGGGRRL